MKKRLSKFIAVLMCLVIGLPAFAVPVQARVINVAPSVISQETRGGPKEEFDFSGFNTISSDDLVNIPGRAMELAALRASANSRELDTVTATLDIPIGAVGFEDDYAIDNPYEIIEIIVQFRTPPAVGLRLLDEANHTLARRFNLTPENYESTALAAHSAFMEQLDALPSAFSDSGSIEIFSSHHSLLNGVFMRVPGHMVESIAALPEVFAVTPNYVWTILGTSETDYQLEIDYDINNIDEEDAYDDDEDEDISFELLYFSEWELNPVNPFIIVNLPEIQDAVLGYNVALHDLQDFVLLAEYTWYFKGEDGSLEAISTGYFNQHQENEISHVLYNVTPDMQGEYYIVIEYTIDSEKYNSVIGEPITVIVTEAMPIEITPNSYFIDPMDVFMRGTLEVFEIDEVREKLGLRGKGIRIGVIDTGIDYNHPVFHSSRIELPEGGYGFRGYDFIDMDEDPMETLPGERWGHPGTDHGTHVAGIIAAIAPDATYFAYRVLAPNAQGHVTNVGASVHNAIEAAHTARLDVLNLSIGAFVNAPFDAAVYMLNLAVLDGINIAIASGNNGNYGWYSHNTPGVGSLPISVGNAETGGFGQYTMTGSPTIDGKPVELSLRGWGWMNDPMSFPGDYNFETFGIISELAEIEPGDVNAWVKNHPVYSQVDLDKNTIAVMSRGGLVSFVKNHAFAAAINAAGVIIVDHDDDDLFYGRTPVDGILGWARIPTWFASYDSRELFGTPEKAGEKGVITMGAMSYTPLNDVMGRSSSHGPVWGTYHIKPDIVAPGTNVMSTMPAFKSNLDENTHDFSGAFALMTGTSMASPSIAGVLALMAEHFPEMKPHEIKARIMNTARPMSDEYSVRTIGAGFARPLLALTQESVATVEHGVPWFIDGERTFVPQTMSSLSFGVVHLPDEEIGGYSHELTVVIQNAQGSWAQSASHISSHPGVVLEMINPTSVGTTRTFTYRFAMAPDAVTGFYEGNIMFTNGTENITMPYAVMFRDRPLVAGPISPGPYNGIVKPIVSNFLIEYYGQDDPREFRTPHPRQISNSNAGAALIGFLCPNTIVPPPGMIINPRPIDFYAIRVDGSNAGETYYYGTANDIGANLTYWLLDLPRATEHDLDGRILPDGVYEFMAYVRDLEYPIEISLGQFIMTGKRPEVIFDDYVFSHDGSGSMTVTGRISSWSHDLAMELGGLTFASGQVPIEEAPWTVDTLNPWDYSRVWFRHGNEIFGPDSVEKMYEVQPDGRFSFELKGVENVGLDEPYYLSNFFVSDALGRHSANWGAANRSLPAGFYIVHQDLFDDTILKYDDVSADFALHSNEVRALINTRAVDLTVPLSWNLELLKSLTVSQWANTPPVTVQWLKNGEVAGTIKDKELMRLAQIGINPAVPGKSNSFDAPLSYLFANPFAENLKVEDSGVFTLRIIIGDLDGEHNIYQSPPITLTISELPYHDYKVVVSPDEVTADFGQSISFEATVFENEVPMEFSRVTWTLTDVNGNAAVSRLITNTGNLQNRAAITISPNEKVTPLILRATSVLDPRQSAVATININIPETRTVLYSLANDANIQQLAPGTFTDLKDNINISARKINFDPEAEPDDIAHEDIHNVKVQAIAFEGRRALEVTGWGDMRSTGVSIEMSALRNSMKAEENYEIYVRGRLVTGFGMMPIPTGLGISLYSFRGPSDPSYYFGNNLSWVPNTPATTGATMTYTRENTASNPALSNLDANGNFEIRYFISQERLKEIVETHPDSFFVLTGFPMTENLAHIPMQIYDITLTRLEELPSYNLQAPSLAQHFAGSFGIGNVIYDQTRHDWTKAPAGSQQRQNSLSVNYPSNVSQMLEHHYNVLSSDRYGRVEAWLSFSGNNLGNPTWTFTDAFVDFAENNNMETVWRNLVVSQPTPYWFHARSDTPSEAFRHSREHTADLMEQMIKGVGERYDDRLDYVHVVSEIIFQGFSEEDIAEGWRGALKKGGNNLPDPRANRWYNNFAQGGEDGSDFIYYAFAFARQYIPSAKLYISELNLHNRMHAQVMRDLVQEMNERWLEDERNTEPERPLIEGISLQMRIDASLSTNPAALAQDLSKSLEMFATLGVEISISELEVNMPRSLVFTGPSNAILQHQGEIYNALFAEFLTYADYISHVTFRNHSDAQAWFSPMGNPALFNANLEPKPAFEAILAAEGRMPAVVSVSVSPATVNVVQGGTQQFNAAVNAVHGAATNVTWSVSGHGGAAIDAAGLLTIQAGVPAGTVLTVTATSTFDPSVHGTAIITVIASSDKPAVLGIVVSPAATSIIPGRTQQFNAAVNAVNGAAATVIWSVTGHSGAAISATGLLTVGANVPAGTVLTVTATSTFDPSVHGTATVTVTAGQQPPTTLAAPVNVSQNNGLLTWNVVSNATAYRVYVNGTAQTVVTAANFNLNTLSFAAGDYIVQVRALGNGTTWLDSALSASVNFRIAPPPGGGETGGNETGGGNEVTPSTGGRRTTTAPPQPPQQAPEVPQQAPSLPQQEPSLPQQAPVLQSDIFFNDVSQDDWFYEYVMTAAARGLFTGTAQNIFSPNLNMTRAMFAAVLVRLSGVDLDEYRNVAPTFSDVSSDQWYFSAVEWAARNGIIMGVSSNDFAPDAPITREQMAVMLFRFIETMDIEIPAGASNAFTDQDAISTWATDAVVAIQAMGIITGRPNGAFDPQATATRAEVATVFTRFLQIAE